MFDAVEKSEKHYDVHKAKKYNGIIKYVPFPEHLKGKYQTYTCAKKEWDYKFTTIEDYIK